MFPLLILPPPLMPAAGWLPGTAPRRKGIHTVCLRQLLPGGARAAEASGSCWRNGTVALQPAKAPSAHGCSYPVLGSVGHAAPRGAGLAPSGSGEGRASPAPRPWWVRWTPRPHRQQAARAVPWSLASRPVSLPLWSLP